MKLPLPRASIVIAILSLPFASNAEETYQIIKEIPVGGEGGWDYLTVDPAARRLYVAHATKVAVIDLEKDAVVGEIADTPGVHGIALAPELGRGFCSNGKDSSASIVNLQTLKTIAKVQTGENPDAILYEPAHKEVYAFNGRSRSVTVFDAQTETVSATIPLSGKPEFAACDPLAGCVFDCIEDKSEIAVIATSTHKVCASWPVAPGEQPSGLAIDLEHHRLFIGCKNKLTVMMDSGTGKVLATFPIGEGVDANAYDPGTGLAFASCGDGTVTIAKEESPDKVTVVQVLKTEVHARTMAVDPTSHMICLPSAKFEPLPPEAEKAPRKRPKMVPDTLKILVGRMK